MAFFRSGMAVASTLLLIGSTAFAGGLHHKASSKNHRSSFRAASGMAADRASEIQAALIKAHYLDGQPSGVWDEQSKSAMTRFQGDNGWQTRTTPDSRALIKLGLGPDQTGAAPLTTASSASPATAAAPAHNTLGSAIASQQELIGQ